MVRTFKRLAGGTRSVTDQRPLTVEAVVMPDWSRSWTVVQRSPRRTGGPLSRLPPVPSPVTQHADRLRLRLRVFVQFLDDHGLAWTDVEVDHLARFVRRLEQPAGNVVLLHDAQPARSPATTPGR